MARGFQDDIGIVTIKREQLDNGIEPATSNITDEFGFEDNLVNFHKHQFDGFGPRYGMAPLPYQSIPIATGTPSLVNMETIEERTRLYAMLPVRLALFPTAAAALSGPLRPSALHSVWVCAARQSAVGAQGLAVYFNSDQDSGFNPINYGPYANTYLTRYRALGTAQDQWSGLFTRQSASVLAAPTLKRQITNWPNAWASVASMTVPGRVIPFPWIAGEMVTDATATVPPLIATKEYLYTSEFAFLNQKGQTRTLRVFRIETDGTYLFARTQYNVDAAGPYYVFRNVTTRATTDIDAANVTFGSTATYGVAGAYSNAGVAVYNDENALHNQRHSVIAVAYGRPFGFFLKEECLQSTTNAGTVPLVSIDFTQYGYAPVDRTTTSASGNYKENGEEKPTCWRQWEDWTAGTATGNDATIGTLTNRNVALGAADSGLLRKNTTYEFTFAVYNKIAGHETNVGTPARIETGTDDFVALQLRRARTTGGTSTGANNCSLPSRTQAPFPTPSQFYGGAVTDKYMNAFEYRVYYREVGAFEWLPAGSIDAVEYFFNASQRVWAVCEGPSAALPGGQPGGFNDYSPLPDDEYFQTLTFGNRLFWFSPKAGVYSLKDNPYAYAVRNAFGCAKGSFTGAIAHAYPGQAEQDARLVIFTTEETITGRFRGSQYGIQQPVRVSPDFVGQFYLDGSDFDLRVWSSITAFSYRSAVNAKGVLYFWGPDGIYRDEGVDLPTKAWSEYMDPLFATLYDKSKTAQIHSVYNTRTREVLWFFLAPDGTQKALVYNTKSDSFFLFTFANILIDASQVTEFQLSGSNLRAGMTGKRIVLMCRDAVDTTVAQRPVFFDELVDGGDVRISRVFMCSAVTTNGANRRLSIRTGYVGSLPASGKLTISGSSAYMDAVSSVDGIYDIVTQGGSFIEIAPIGGSWTGVDFPGSFDFFPVWVDSVHGFDLIAESAYFAPGGFNFYARWLYCEQLIKVDRLLRNGGYSLSMQWKSTDGGTTASTRTLTLVDNYRGNFRVHSQIAPSQGNTEGNGLATTWTTPSGKHTGGRWTVQMLQYRTIKLTDGNQRAYEG